MILLRSISHPIVHNIIRIPHYIKCLADGLLTAVCSFDISVVDREFVYCIFIL